MRPLFKFFLLPLLLVLITICFNVLYRYHISTSGNAKVIIGERMFSIPKNYIDANRRKDIHTNGVILRRRWDFQFAKPDTDIRDQVELKIQQKAFRGVFLQNPDRGIDLEILVPRFLSQTYLNSQELRYKKHEEDKYGLVGYTLFPYPHQDADVELELFIEYSETKQILSYIRCSPKKTSPDCTQNFFNNDVYYKFAFNYKELKNWKENKKLIIDFIEEMAISDSEN